MKKFLLLTLAILLPVIANAKALSTDEKFLLNNNMGPVASLIGLGDVIDASESLVKATWDATVNSGGSSTVSSGSHNLGVALPAGAVITRSWYQVITATDSVGSANRNAQLSLACETADNIISHRSLSTLSAGDITDGVSDDALSNFKKITNACNVTAKITIQPFTVGKIVAFIRYYVAP